MEQVSLEVSLREVTKENLKDIFRLGVAESQSSFVATNEMSIAEAYFEAKAWFRAIYAGEQPVGFVMLYIDSERPKYYIWRFMIDQRYQGKGYGRKALELVIDFVRGFPNAREIFLHYVPAEGGAGPFYQKFGFVDTGEWEDDEKEMRLALV